MRILVLSELPLPPRTVLNSQFSASTRAEIAGSDMSGPFGSVAEAPGFKVPVLPMPVPAHLPSISVHVVQTEAIGLEAPNWTQASNDRILIVVCKLRVQRIAVRITQSGYTSTTCLLPLGLCRQPITFCTPVYVGFVDLMAKMASSSEASVSFSRLRPRNTLVRAMHLHSKQV